MKTATVLRYTPLALALASLGGLPAWAAGEAELKPVVVTPDRTTGSKPILREEVVATESISAGDLRKSGATTLTEALDKRPGISMQSECSICNVRNVVLNNLPGRYTTVMIDGIPIFSSVSSAYGLDSVSLGGVERIDIARGAGASLIAPEALAGSVNVITRRPLTNEALANAQLGQYGHAQTDLFGARVFDGGALTANFSHNRHKQVDGDDNGLSEYSGYRRNLGGVGFFADALAGFKLKGRVDFVEEKRNGGAIGTDYDSIKGNTSGNPFDWSRGPNGSPDARGWVTPDGSGADTLSNGQQGTFYDSGRAGMSEIILTKRSQLVSSATRKLGDGSLRLAFAYAHHNQDSFYETTIYNARQDQYYVEASTQQPIGASTLLTAGLNYRYEDLYSKGVDSSGNANNGLDNYSYRTPGIFVQGYRAMFDDKLEANVSLRADQHNIFGTIYSPRMNLLWNHTKEINSRLALGKGYRAPTSFFEQDHGILDTTRIERRITRAEESQNASYTLSYAGDRLGVASSLNWNRIKNMATLDTSQTDPVTGDPITIFGSADRAVIVRGVDITATYKLTTRLEGTVGLEKSTYTFNPGTLAFARPEERAYLRLDYASDQWDFMLRGTWTGPQDLARFYDYQNNPRYNLDGTAKQNKSPAFWVFDTRGEYKIDKRWSAFMGIDNLLDYKQADKDSYLWLDGAGEMDVTHIWGPNRGRFIYAGAKLAF